MGLKLYHKLCGSASLCSWMRTQLQHFLTVVLLQRSKSYSLPNFRNSNESNGGLLSLIRRLGHPWWTKWFFSLRIAATAVLLLRLSITQKLLQQSAITMHFFLFSLRSQLQLAPKVDWVLSVASRTLSGCSSRTYYKFYTQQKSPSFQQKFQVRIWFLQLV